MNRRDFLAASGALGLGTTFGTSALATEAGTGRKRALRVAHLTDIHISGITGAEQGMRAALRHAQGLDDKPDLLLFGGDCIGDALDASKESALEQWALWDRIFSEEVKTPFRHCLGNHDIYGWRRRGSAKVRMDPDYGKTMGLKRLGLERGYYSFDLNGWHFVVLDSMQPDNNSDQSYMARLDEAQFSWLTSDLEKNPAATPVCVLSHIPILSAAAFLDGDLAGSGNSVVPGAWMHLDCRRIKDLFRKHPNVKACLSGHLHMVDDVRFQGVRYLCNGAVCGGWWKGSYQNFAPLYSIIDYFDDGTLTIKYVTY